VSERRQGSRPRSGSGPRVPAAARSAGARRQASRARAPAHAPQQQAPTAADREADSVAEAEPRAPSDELSSWQRLLYELDKLLRDPTLTRALARSVARLRAGLRDVSVATRDAIRRLGQALRGMRIPFPRRLLLGLLALMLPFVLFALLSSSDDERRAPGARAVTPVAAGSFSNAVRMPDVGPAPAKVHQVRVALVLDRTYGAATLRRELSALGTWLAVNHAPGTRVSVIDAKSARASRPARGTELAGVRPQRQRASTAAAVRSAFGRQRDRRLLVTLGTAAPSSTGSTLRIATRRGAGGAGAGIASGAGSGSSTAPGRRKRLRATIDDRRPNALAASIARAIMTVSGQRERR
jgi:hypothetical protein